MALLSVQDLVTRFELRRGAFNVVDRLSLEIDEGETVGLVGESGCGKSITLRSIIHALPAKAKITGGRITYAGRDVTRPSRRTLLRIRGREIAMIFQDPLTALNPVLTVGHQLLETLKQSKGLTGESARRRAVELLRLVGVPEPERRLHTYPHELSGGMAQRVVIAIALVGEPRLLLADEPTTALDVTVQAQILQLLTDLQAQFHMSILLVTHDLGVVAQTCNRIYVMYAGRVVEEADALHIFEQPRHPYTVGLLGSVPRVDGAVSRGRLPSIPGAPPDLSDPPGGCRFNPRCPLKIDECLHSDVRLLPVNGAHWAACIRHNVVQRGAIAFEPVEQAGEAASR